VAAKQVTNVLFSMRNRANRFLAVQQLTVVNFGAWPTHLYAFCSETTFGMPGTAFAGTKTRTKEA
jgi:hypothetical protein